MWYSPPFHNAVTYKASRNSSKAETKMLVNKKCLCDIWMLVYRGILHDDDAKLLFFSLFSLMVEYSSLKR